MVAVQKCFKLLDIPQENFKQGELKKKWPTKAEIVFDNVHLRYRDKTKMVLEGFKAKIKGGEKIGVVGRTGAGKSTMSLALTRIIELASG